MLFRRALWINGSPDSEGRSQSAWSGACSSVTQAAWHCKWQLVSQSIQTCSRAPPSGFAKLPLPLPAQLDKHISAPPPWQITVSVRHLVTRLLDCTPYSGRSHRGREGARCGLGHSITLTRSPGGQYRPLRDVLRSISPPTHRLLPRAFWNPDLQ